MAPRLLTLLSYIENALANHGSQAVSVPPARSVNFHKSLARMTFMDGSGSIMLQNFTLAEGQICVRAVFSWEGNTASSSHSIYPRDSFDWQGAADQLATAWLAGQSAATAPVQTSPEAAVPSMEPVAATG